MTTPPPVDVPAGPDAAAGKEPRRRRPRTRAGRITMWIAFALALVVFALSIGGWAAYRYYDRRIDRVHLALGNAGRPPVAPQGVQNYLLVGSDDRAGTNGEYGDFPGQRSDSTILVHLARNGTATVLSFPRDMYVPIPAYTNAGGAHPGHRDRLNAAISLGGPTLLVRTLESLTGIRVSHYLSVDLEGFKAMTNAIGGVDVCVAPLPAWAKAEGYDNTTDKDTGWRGHVGINHLDGEQALAFVRTRKSLPGGDLDRVKRQQHYLAVVFKKATSAGMLTSPVSVERLLRAFSGALTMDDNTSVTNLRQLITRLRGMHGRGVTYETVPTRTPGTADGAVFVNGLWEIDGQAVQVYDQVGMEALLRPLRGVTTVTPTTASTPSPTPAPGTSPRAPGAAPPGVRAGSGRAGDGAGGAHRNVAVVPAAFVSATTAPATTPAEPAPSPTNDFAVNADSCVY